MLSVWLKYDRQQIFYLTKSPYPHYIPVRQQTVLIQACSHLYTYAAWAFIDACRGLRRMPHNEGLKRPSMLVSRIYPSTCYQIRGPGKLSGVEEVTTGMMEPSFFTRLMFIPSAQYGSINHSSFTRRCPNCHSGKTLTDTKFLG